MQGYFSKVKGSAINLAKKGATLIGNVVSASLTHSDPSQRPEQEFESLFTLICSYFDQEAIANDGNSAEADARLQQSGVRGALKRMLVLLQNDDLAWLAVQRTLSKENDEVKIPVIDYLLHKNVINQLCHRAMNDLPRGSMPLILTTLSNILKSAKYPLLPHQSVYKPINNLLSVASRYEAVFSAHQRRTPAERERLATYKRRIVIGLTSLLRTIWRKVVEHPPLLDLFILNTRRGSASPKRPSWSLTPQGPSKTHFDLLSSLLPLLDEPRVSIYVLESLLVAFSLKDPRITIFLAEETKFAERLVISLCDHFQSALVALQSMQAQSSSSGQHAAGRDSCPDYLTVLLPSGPAQAQPARQSDPHAQAAHPSAAAAAAVAPSAVQDLVRCLAVLRAVYTTLRATAAAAAASASNTQGNSNQSCLSVLAYEFVTRFLLGTLRPSLDSSSEGQNIAVYTLLRLLLATLAVHGRDASLPDGTANLIEPVPTPSGDVLAVASTSGPALSLLSLTLRMILLGPQAMDGLVTAPLVSAVESSAEDPFEPLVQDHDISPPSTPAPASSRNSITSQHIGDFVMVLWDRIGSQSRALSLSASLLLCSLLQTSPPLLGLLHVHSLPYSLGAAATAAALSNHAAGHDSMQGAGSWSASRMDADPAGLFSQQLTNALQMFDHDASSSNGNGSHSWSKLLPSSAENGKTMRMAYTKTASRMLSKALFHSGDRLLSWPAAFFDRCLIGLTFHDQLIPTSATAAGVTLREGSFLDRLSKRLQVFAHLRVYEQLLVSELLQQSMCQLALVMVLGSESTAQRCLLVAQLLLHKVENMLKDVAVAAQKQVPDVARKWTMLQDYLSSEAVEYLHCTDDGGSQWEDGTNNGVAVSRTPDGPSNVPTSTAPASMTPTSSTPSAVPAANSARKSSFLSFSPVSKLLAGNVFDESADVASSSSSASSKAPVSKKAAASGNTSTVTTKAPLASSATDSAKKSQPNRSATVRRQIESEPNNAKAMLITCLLLQEMLWEAQGFVATVHSLRRRFSTECANAASSNNELVDGELDEAEVAENKADLTSLQTLIASLSARSTAYSHYDDVQPFPHQNGERKAWILADIEGKEAEFLQEYSGLEALLDSLAASG